MRILGKTWNDVRAEHQAVVESRQLAAQATGHPEAEKASEAARAALSEFHRTTKPAMLAEIGRLQAAHERALGDAVQKQNDILGALLKLRRNRIKHAHLKVKGHLADEPAGSPEEVRINGELYDPTKGVNPATGM